ncbi:3-isopropylmalate dehydratase small subunit [Aquibaculum sediminis]|uniref:3-isopropylmalate dehydratase small subunit n=1 Tax=Aquibaculum sediminis TaxID=3231907 RepID=UPI0034557EEC
MEKFNKLTAVAAPLPMVNVDTDMIIPARFLKTIKRTGLAEGLFYALRHNQDGSPKDFVLDRPAYKNAKILIAGDNFGCGSSREHAPWALLDAGIRCVIAPSFADIFHNNCFKNGILPIVLPEEQVNKMMEAAERGANATMTVDLESQTIQGPDGEVIPFEVDAWKKHCLLNGLDDVGQTLQNAPAIDSFEAKQQASQPWLYG